MVNKNFSSGWQKIAVIIIIVVIILIIVIGIAYLYKNYQKKADSGPEVNTEEPIDSDQPIGAQRDEHGCLVSAGYSWIEEIGACGRNWESSEEQKKAAKLAVDYVGQSYSLTVTEVMVARCPGCFIVKLDEENQERKLININDWQVKKDFLTAEECESQGGQAVDIASGGRCGPGEENIADVIDFSPAWACCMSVE